MLTKKTSKNQVTLPKAIVNAFPDTHYFDVSIKDNKILLMPVKIMPVGSTLEGLREKMKKLGIVKEVTGDVRGICRDPEDEKFISCALSASADSIVSGDKDLLDLRKFKSVKIVKVSDFLKMFD